MTTITDDTIDTLNHLIELCRDSAACFATAAKEVTYPELAPVFRTLALQRQGFVEKLTACVHQLGGEPEGRGTWTGTARLGWMQLREALAVRNARALLLECERTEERVVAGYRDALAKLVDPACVAVVRHQSFGAHGGYDSIRGLRECVAYRGL
ncbi:PA2169 family four-helix-bundle protein [Synoicihabitans lomoniglobus]|uniref:PA2169 family four-helix-bundle protein n=1 Tax=Synoicihabitans lomoniglobus TaxID=2909285 RepID=A0AAE9ZWX6_9BACT|nr:PA2169 family four-helix-bundle protein [Opitutaceae bacterium LMO-M01]WED64704.1 PA2169 family four-helix-bundle protein [Opitutaceae bacterium LMO-M01]